MKASKGVIFLASLSLLLIMVSSLVVARYDNPFSDQNFMQFIEKIPGIGWFAGLGFVTVCFLFLILPLVIALLLCAWIYKDAEKRGKEGILWVILLIIAAIVFNLLGVLFIVVLWLVVRPPIQK